jgi:hypothetical protein
MTDPGHRSKSNNHLLIHNEDRNQEWKNPKEGESKILSSLGISGDSTGVIISDHDNDPWAEYRQKSEKADAKASSR